MEGQEMKDSLGKITSDKKILYPVIGAVSGVVILGLITFLGTPAVYVLLAVAAGGFIGHLVRKFGDDGF